MPKKFGAENTKAVLARQRKKQAKDEVEVNKKQAAQDQYWQDDDKELKKKQQRKETEEKKRHEALQRKAEAKIILEQEMNTISKQTGTKLPPRKVTRAEINTKTTSLTKQTKLDVKKIETHLEIPLIENVNRIEIEGDEARTVDKAITILGSNTEAVDKHPEKRLKAAYSNFEERRLKELKSTNPLLRLSQLKQMIFKEWPKSSENPLNR